MGTITFAPEGHRLLSGHPTLSLESWGWLSQSKVEEGAGRGEEGPEKRFFCHSLVGPVWYSGCSWHSCRWAQLLGNHYSPNFIKEATRAQGDFVACGRSHSCKVAGICIWKWGGGGLSVKQGLVLLGGWWKQQKKRREEATQ